MSAWPFDLGTDLDPPTYLAQVGTVFARFDARTQDSGNVSFGVEAAGRRWFVKTAGDPAETGPALSHSHRVELLSNARELAQSVNAPILPAFHRTVASAWGPMLVYAFVPGELLHAPAARRGDPDGAFQRFGRLPRGERAQALSAIIAAHVDICAAGWIACDFYDGSILYDFARRRTWLVDLDCYRRGAFTNEMGRLFGSTRFMAPEEFERGARIDERTTVFTLGRTISVLMGDGGLERGAFGGTDAHYRAMARACEPDPAARFATVAELAQAWRG